MSLINRSEVLDVWPTPATSNPFSVTYSQIGMINGFLIFGWLPFHCLSREGHVSIRFLLQALIELSWTLPVYWGFKTKIYFSLLYKSRICIISVLYPVERYIRRPWQLLEITSMDSFCISTAAHTALGTGKQPER